MDLDIKGQPWMEDLLSPYRYKILYGGRSSGKSHAVAQALLAISLQKRNCNILCCREHQKAIKDSVYFLLKEKAAQLKIDKFFIFQHDKILVPRSNSQFIFEGLAHNIETIRSKERITHCWIEEAQYTSEASWKDLYPTIRADDSELWCTMNPRFKTDVIYKNFILNKQPETMTFKVPDEKDPTKKVDKTIPWAFVRKVNWQENPYNSYLIQIEAMQDKERYSHEDYMHIWEGECKVISGEAIFKDHYVIEEFEEDPRPRKYFGLDFGFSKDPTAGIRCYTKKDGLKDYLYITHEAVKTQVPLDELANFLREHLPDIQRNAVYADSSRPDTIQLLRKNGLNVKGANRKAGSRIDGIEFLKKFYIAVHPRCVNTIDELSRYSYINKMRKYADGTEEEIAKPEDRYDHCIDALRYATERLREGRGLNYSEW